MQGIYLYAEDGHPHGRFRKIFRIVSKFKRYI